MTGVVARMKQRHDLRQEAIKAYYAKYGEVYVSKQYAVRCTQNP